MTTDTLPPGVGLRLLGGESPLWAEGYRLGWERCGNIPPNQRLRQKTAAALWQRTLKDSGYLPHYAAVLERGTFEDGYLFSKGYIEGYKARREAVGYDD